MKKIIHTGWLIPLMIAVGISGARGQTGPISARWDGDTAIYEAGEWTLQITYLLKGTQNEGQEGVLLRRNSPVEPAAPGEIIQTSLGELKHWGSERKQLSDVTGWNFATRAKILRSEQVNTTAAAPAATEVPAVNNAPMAKEITFGDQGGQQLVSLPVGGALTVRLKSNPSTGYSWSVAVADPTVIAQVGKSEFTAEQTDRIGVAGTERFEFKSGHQGVTTILFQYRRPWEKNTPPIVTAGIQITVE